MKKILLFLIVFIIPIIIFALPTGDVDGDGYVRANDYIKIRKHLLGQNILTGNELKRADVDGNNGVKAADYIAVRKIILGVNMPTPLVTSTPESTERPTITQSPTPTNKPTVTPKPTTAKIHFVKAGDTTLANLGDADIILIESNGHYGLVDAGRNNKKAVDYLQSVGVKYLDFVVATHGHDDHIGGIPQVAAEFVNSNTTYYYRDISKGYYFSGDDAYVTNLVTTAKKAMSDKKATLVDVTDKTNIQFSLGDFNFVLLNTASASSDEKRNGKVAGANKDSIVTYVQYNGKHGTLLTGDMESQDEYRMVSNDVLKDKPVEVLKVAHHSWQSSTTMKFTKYVSPKIAVVTGNYLLEDISTPVYYMQQKYGTKFYVVGKSDSAVIIDYTKDNLSVSPEKALESNYEIVDGDDNWRKLKNGIWFYLKTKKDLNSIVYDDFVKASNNKWYYFGLQGNMIIGWAEVKYGDKSGLFYFNPDKNSTTYGAMITGWAQPIEISTYNKDRANNWYETGLYTHINYTFDAWYTYITDTKKSSWANGRNWFYFDRDGAMVSDKCLEISKVKYCFDKNGICTSKGC